MKTYHFAYMSESATSSSYGEACFEVKKLTPDSIAEVRQKIRAIHPEITQGPVIISITELESE